MLLKMTVKNANEAYVLNDSVREQGLSINGDYSWRYIPAMNDYFGATVLTPATVEFEFQDPKWATYFQLRWAK